MRKWSLAVVVVAAVSLTAVSSVAQDAAMHDLECFVSMKTPEASSNEKTRWGASAVAAFYLGRLDQKGLTLEQIQSGVEMILRAPVLYQETQSTEFTAQCFRDVNDRVSGLKVLAARNRGLPKKLSQ
jgi:hypothetical protein